MKVETPPDYRIVPLIQLREVIPLPDHDAEERAERRILHRGEIKKALDK